MTQISEFADKARELCGCEACKAHPKSYVSVAAVRFYFACAMPTILSHLLASVVSRETTELTESKRLWRPIKPPLWRPIKPPYKWSDVAWTILPNDYCGKGVVYRTKATHGPVYHALDLGEFAGKDAFKHAFDVVEQHFGYLPGSCVQPSEPADST